MKTRADLYGGEATELLRIISMYPGLTEKQLCRFYPGREDVTRNLLSHLARQGHPAGRHRWIFSIRKPKGGN